MKAIQQKTGLKDLSLRDVPLDSFQVCVLVVVCWHGEHVLQH